MLSFELKIKEGLVYDKHTAHIIGFVMVSDFIDEASGKTKAMPVYYLKHTGMGILQMTTSWNRLINISERVHPALFLTMHPLIVKWQRMH